MSNVARETEVTSFGRMPDGTEVNLYTVWAGKMTASFTEFGARMVSVKVPDRTGRVGDVVLGFDSLAMYLADKAFMGAVVGRYGNRIAGGKFSLGGQQYQIPVNDGPNALHGGTAGFDQRIWKGHAIADGVEFTLVSPDGDQGFPGKLTLKVTYTFVAGVLTVQYEGRCDKDTVVNVTNHAYFNLAGDSSGNVLGHEIEIPADLFTPVDATMIPTGELAEVDGTPFDLRDSTRVGRYIDGKNEQLRIAGGYDHNWVLGERGVMKMASRVSEPGSGRSLTVETTEPGVQFYSGNFLDGTMPNRRGGLYKKRSGFCLETQHYPDSPNKPEFPTTELKAGSVYRSTTVFRFGVVEAEPEEDRRRMIM